MSFVSELKRRNVLRVGAAYLVVAWLALQIVDTVGPMLSLPHAFARGALLLLAIGLPVVLAGSWIFELTPEGLRTQRAADESGHRTSTSRLNAVVIGGLALALVFVIVDAYVLSESAPPQTAGDQIEDAEATNKTVAVLPFINNSPDPQQEYFSDGLTDALLNKLARVPDMQVAGRASSFYYKGRNEDLRAIGNALGVNHIVLGSVRKDGNDIRINAQLVSAADGFQLWSDSFEFEMLDVFAVQDEIAEDVTRALEVTLAIGDFSLPGNTQNVEAYDAAMQASYEMYQLRPEALREAIRLAQRAVELDPEYARGWLALRVAYSLSSTFLPAEESAEFTARADEAQRQAEAIAPELWEVQQSTMSDAIRIGQYLNAFTTLENAREDRALSARQYDLYRGILSSLAGQNRDALASLQQARLGNPFDVNLQFNLAIVLFRLGRIEEAMFEISRGEALDETTALFFALKARIARQQQNWAEAESLYIGVGRSDIYLVLDQFLQSGDAPGGLDAIREFISSAQAEASVVSLALAEYASQFGDPALSVELLNSAAGQGQGGYIGVNIWNPAYATVRQHPGFKALVDDLGFVDYWRATGNWGDYCRPLEGGDDFECF